MATTDDDSAMDMAPPPNRTPANASMNSANNDAAVTADVATTEVRHMNDTTMPPPKGLRYNNNKPSIPAATAGTRKTAVDVRARGPRFGLHDWKRLLARSNDLAQRKGAPLRRDITKEEVKKHNKVYDGWCILRGRVYNLGPYLAYHPGGQEILVKILGKDATSLFDKYHRWVNIDGLIGPLLLGSLAMDAPAPSPFSVVPPKESHLTNAPRVSTQAASGTSLLAKDDSDEEEERILPIP